MKKLFVLVALLSSFAGMCFGQSAEKVSEMLEKKETTLGDVSYFSAVSQELAKEKTSSEECFKILKDKGFFSESQKASDAATIGDVAFVCSKTFGIEESLMYKIFKNKRYAYRQIKALGMLSSSSQESDCASGNDILALFSECIEKGGN